MKYKQDLEENERTETAFTNSKTFDNFLVFKVSPYLICVLIISSDSTLSNACASTYIMIGAVSFVLFMVYKYIIHVGSHIHDMTLKLGTVKNEGLSVC